MLQPLKLLIFQKLPIVIFLLFSIDCQSNKIKKQNKKEKVKEMIEKLKYDCFHVTLKITPLLTGKVAIFYDRSLLIQRCTIRNQSLLGISMVVRAHANACQRFFLPPCRFYPFE